MKTSTNFIRRIVITSAVSFALAAPLMAQQEVSPDRFETAQNVQNPGPQKAEKRVSFKTANKQTAKARNLRHSAKQTAYMKNASGFDQIARK